MGIWDHWVPAANPVLRGLVDEWAAKNKVEVTIDFIPSAGNKIVLTQAAEAQAGSGHDILAFDQWNAQQYANKLTPMSVKQPDPSPLHKNGSGLLGRPNAKCTPGNSSQAVASGSDNR